MTVLSAWSPDGFRFFCAALALSILIVEFIKSIVDLIPGEIVNFIVYNVYGFVVFNSCLYCGRTVYHRKIIWFINGLLTSSVFMLWYASLFDTGKAEILPIVYAVELCFTAFTLFQVRKYEHPKEYEDLAKFRNTVVPIDVIDNNTRIQRGLQPVTL